MSEEVLGVVDEPRTNPTDIVGRDAALLSTEATARGELARLDERIADPNTQIQDALILTRIRGELIRQDELRLDRDHARRSETRQFWGKLGFSVGAVGTGIGLIAMGFRLEGFLAMGIGFHWLAPDFVRSLYDRILGTESKSDA